ncbi:deleted in malignant brain tumors 1 protein-like isoform X2 [Pecten maximus]|uniref:deleted in malignant brain tumors 1 protein-like isoform X2 n=1 Tax=Pecten maximus TaxID=6579 RepID=UPI001458C120|nr:deleted in malignant brain tumors 1 protein-like isoform X2 [Pecten maximus]
MAAVKFLLIFMFLSECNRVEMRADTPMRSVTTEGNPLGHTGEDTRNAGMKRRREDCGPGDLHGPRATIESPYNAGYYHLYFHCWWTMHVTPNTTVRLEFERFDLYTGHDYVIVYDGSRDVTGKLTGFINVPYFVDSTGDTMRVEYVTDIAFTTNGFKATLQEIDRDQEPTTTNNVLQTSEHPVTITSSAASSYSSDIYTRAISTGCYQDAWDIRIYLPDLYKLHSDFDPSDIYLGRPGCEGYRSGDYLIIHQQYTDCLTHLMTTTDVMEYTNMLIYAYRDPNYKFIVRDYRFKIDVHCDLPTHETVSQHFIETHNKVRKRSNNPSVSGSGHYNIHMSFYRDSTYRQQMTGSPLMVDIGQDVYVSVTTPLSDFYIKMRVESCFTLPLPGAGDHLKFYLIKTGCSSDVNTHVIHQSSHETRFVFRDFEYSNQDDLYLYCTATFCNVTDDSSACDQSCHNVQRRSIQSASDIHLQKADTSDVLHLSKDHLQRDVDRLGDIRTPGHAQYISVNDHLFIAVMISALGISVIGIFVAIRRYRKPKTKPNELI